LAIHLSITFSLPHSLGLFNILPQIQLIILIAVTSNLIWAIYYGVACSSPKFGFMHLPIVFSLCHSPQGTLNILPQIQFIIIIAVKSNLIWAIYYGVACSGHKFGFMHWPIVLSLSHSPLQMLNIIQQIQFIIIIAVLSDLIWPNLIRSGL
jgi:hypothetical protein